MILGYSLYVDNMCFRWRKGGLELEAAPGKSWLTKYKPVLKCEVITEMQTPDNVNYTYTEVNKFRPTTGIA